MGPTLTLAKIANHAAKKNRAFNGVCVLDNALERAGVLAKIDVGNVWGIGRKLSQKMKFMGIHTAFDLAKTPTGIARKNFNIEVERTVRELNGQPCKGWDTARADKKQIYSTRSVGERIVDLESLQQAFSKHAGIASQKARQQGSLCKVLHCFAASSPFDDVPASFRAIHRFAYATADVNHITHAVNTLALELFQEGVRFYKIGVGLIELVDGRHEQKDLFNTVPNNEALMAVFDGLNKKYGSDTVFLGAQGIEQKWQMRRELLTPQYTTKWKDLPPISC
jgi:DNA polymerase V